MPEKPGSLYRHGDILVQQVADLPEEAAVRSSLILARGEATGHCHRIESAATASILEAGGEFFLHVTAPAARLVHEEHAPIELPRGIYRFWHQREYSPEEIRRVVD